MNRDELERRSKKNVIADRILTNQQKPRIGDNIKGISGDGTGFAVLMSLALLVLGIWALVKYWPAGGLGLGCGGSILVWGSIIGFALLIALTILLFTA